MNFNPFKRFNKYDLSKASPELTQKDLQEFNKQRPLGPQELICHAPFKSIYFSHYGKAVACCWNRSFVLGQYPKQSIHDTWFGERAEEFRQYIALNDLEHGCQGCKSHILAGSYDVAKAKMYDERILNDNGYPSVMEFELSNTCNLECEMCNGDFSSLIRKNREGRPPLEEPYDSAFVKQLEEFIPHLEEVKFYGGEPFLVEIYYEIWEKIIEINPSVRISVQTNATILNNRVKRIMEQSQFHLGLSIDSLEKQNYERIRKNAKYETTMANIEWFRSYCKEHDTYFGLAACAMQQNWHELANFVRKGNELEATVSFHTVFFPKWCSFQSLDAGQINIMIETLEKEELPSGSKLEAKNKHQFDDVIKQLRHLFKEKVLVKERDRVVSDTLQLKSIDDIRGFAQKFINENTGWSDAVKRQKQAVVMGKLEALEKRVGNVPSYGTAFKDLDLSSPFVGHQFVNHIAEASITELTAFLEDSLRPKNIVKINPNLKLPKNNIRKTE